MTDLYHLPPDGTVRVTPLLPRDCIAWQGNFQDNAIIALQHHAMQSRGSMVQEIPQSLRSFEMTIKVNCHLHIVVAVPKVAKFPEKVILNILSRSIGMFQDHYQWLEIPKRSR